MDLVFEGEARRVADTPTLEEVAAIYREGGWPVEVDGVARNRRFRSATRAGFSTFATLTLAADEKRKPRARRRPR